MISIMPLKARLKVSTSTLRQTLKLYPGFRELSYGTVLRWLLENGPDDRFYIVEFSKNLITITLHSRASPLYYMQEVLLKTLSIISLLIDSYDLEISSLYPYLINILASNQLSQLRDKVIEKGPKIDLGSDIILAKRINELLRDNSRFGKELAVASDKIDLLLSRFIILRYGNSVDIDLIVKETGLESKDVENSLNRIKEIGYKAVSLGNKRFSLVRI